MQALMPLGSGLFTACPRSNQNPPPRQRIATDLHQRQHILAIHAQTHGSYGWPRIWKELLARGLRVGKERVQKLMQLHGIRAKGKRRFKVTTDSNHDLPIAPNLLDRKFTCRLWRAR